MYVHAPPPAQTQTIVNDGRRISIQTQISAICNSSEYKRLCVQAPNDDRMIAWRKELTRLTTELGLLVSLVSLVSPNTVTPVAVPAVVPEIVEVPEVPEVPAEIPRELKELKEDVKPEHVEPEHVEEDAEEDVEQEENVEEEGTADPPLFDEIDDMDEFS